MTHSIRIDSFEECLNKKIQKNELNSEFKSLNDFKYEVIFSKELYLPLEAETTRSRYPDVLISDKHRVRLPLLENDPNSSFINATWLSGFLPNTKKYIVASAPIPDHFMDWWRMIYHNDVCVIVMLTKLIEGDIKKADKYWPEPGEDINFKIENDNILSVKCHDMNQLDQDTVVNIFSVSLNETNIKKIGLIWNTLVPDQKAPSKSDYGKYRHLMHTYNELYRGLNNSSDRPVLVHCSAGVGRTGFFVAIDMLLDYIAIQSNKSNVSISIYDLVKCFRTRRPSMISNKEQYAFIYSFICYSLEQNK
jgi:protein tyrosine phosphatase